METRRATKSGVSTRSSLEDAFSFEQDRTLIGRRMELRKMAESKEVLDTVSGIINEAILERLVNLNVRPETLAALALVPLIEVVWADGEVDERERVMVLAHARSQGIAPGSVEHELLERWLAHRPEASLLNAWQHYVQGLCECISRSESDVLRYSSFANDGLRPVSAMSLRACLETIRLRWGVAVETRSIEGPWVSSLTLLATTLAACLIVLRAYDGSGADDITRMQRMIEIARMAPCSVLLLPSPPEERQCFAERPTPLASLPRPRNSSNVSIPAQSGVQ